ncbi:MULTISPECIES: hypothetical protein [Flexivirga]|uniref:hypothetical protein n=1 Tax=Flexivirga TaxID=1096776 RepID=UPI00224038AB
MTVQIELLVVPDCPNEAAATELIQAAVRSTGVSANIARTIITNDEEANERGFTGSPTILLNGADPFAEADARIALACRLYSTPTGLRTAPDLTELCRALQRAAHS